MSTKETSRYLELQMQELKESHALDQEENSTQKSTQENNKKDNRDKNAEIAKLYDDAAEYEADLKGFEEELEIVNANELKDIAAVLQKSFPEEDRDYAEELDSVLKIAWTHYVEVEKTHPQEQLELIKETEFCDVVEKLTAAYPEYEGDFETDIREILIKRWEMLISIKQAHIKEELADMKILGLKPKYVKRVYEQYHGLVK